MPDGNAKNLRTGVRRSTSRFSAQRSTFNVQRSTFIDIQVKRRNEAERYLATCQSRIILNLSKSDHSGTLHTTMSEIGLGHADLEGSHLDNPHLLQIDTIAANTSYQDLLQCIREHEATGTPLIITGIDRDSQWESRYSPFLEDGEPGNHRTGTIQNCSRPPPQRFLTLST